MSVKWKILIPAVLLLGIFMTILLVTNIIQFSKNVDSEINISMDTASYAIIKQIDTLKAEARIAALYFAADTEIIEAMERGDGEALLRRANQLDITTGLDYCLFTNDTGTIIAQTQDTGDFGYSAAQMQSVRAALAGVTYAAIEEGAVIKMSASSSAPIVNEQGIMMGVVVTGFRLDTNSFVDYQKSIFDVDVAILKGDVRIASTVVTENGTREIGTRASEKVSRAVLSGEIYIGQAEILNKDAFVEYTPIYDFEGKVIGMLFVGRYLDEKAATVKSFVLVGAAIAIAGFAITIIVLQIVVKRITAPLALLTNFMKKASHTGDLELSRGDVETIGKFANVKDEIGQTISSCAAFVGRVTDVCNALEVMSDGDLTHGMDQLSEKDTMGLALHELHSSLNGMFAEIHLSADQVTAGSKQVADGAQALAQGATEQASSIEELSSSISLIAEKTKSNANMAEQAAVFAETIKVIAEKGSMQMDEMIMAVNDINEASGSIGKVIKVIDDIAFQTNILALNAAVEAARAGQHGKGFAVVAEEVRSLAAKSAEAAKETGNLIEDSIEKANLGVSIANSTAASLTEIVSGINESDRLVSEIASSSEEQSASIEQVNIGIEQVAQVIQQNSAAAEQSAAAAEEMSAQANTLQELISQFKLSGGNKMFRGVSVTEKTDLKQIGLPG